MWSPSKIEIPKPIITRLPIANVTACTFAVRFLCTMPLIVAKKLCQDARNTPKMKRIALAEVLEKSVPIPKIRVVKYATVTGLRSVNPRTSP